MSIPDAPAAPLSRPLAWRLIVAWVMLAALAQLLYLGHWPMHVLGVPVSWASGVGVALVRIGFYTGMAWGLIGGSRVAWAATVLELARSLLFFFVPVVFGDRSLTVSAYPTLWAQGLLTAGLVFLLPLDIALALSWRPPPQLEPALAIAMRVWGSSAALAGLWLRRYTVGYDVPPEGADWTMLRDGLPPVLLISAVEGGAVFWTLAAARL